MISIILNKKAWNEIEKCENSLPWLGKCCVHPEEVEWPPNFAQMCKLTMPHRHQENDFPIISIGKNIFPT